LKIIDYIISNIYYNKIVPSDIFIDGKNSIDINSFYVYVKYTRHEKMSFICLMSSILVIY